MATGGNVVIKTTADAGNTVLFETTGTGGYLRISVDGDNWFQVGGTSAPIPASRYLFADPLIADSDGQVGLRIADNNAIEANDPISVVAVGRNGLIGENLLPDTLTRLKYLWDEDYIVLKSKLPADIVYTTDGAISSDLLPDSVALWDSDNKVISAEHLPDNLVYLSGDKLPVSLIPPEAIDTWEDLTDGMRVQE